jgi:hypothetical protein
MAFKCKGKPWKSRINSGPSSSINDGFIRITTLDVITGNFTGMHFSPLGDEDNDFPITGNCKHPTPENPTQPDFILFSRPIPTEAGCAYVHFGEIVSVSGVDWVFKGIRRKICGAIPPNLTVSALLPGDDEWVGEKTT